MSANDQCSCLVPSMVFDNAAPQSRSRRSTLALPVPHRGESRINHDGRKGDTMKLSHTAYATAIAAISLLALGRYPDPRLFVASR